MNLVHLCCYTPNPTEIDWLSIFGSVANIIIALLTLILGCYVFIYQRRKDNENKIEAQQLHRKNIKLQWFREIVIQPKLQLVFDFFEALQMLRTMLSKSDLNESEKIDIINYIKLEQSKFRKGFLGLIQNVDIELHDRLAISIDKLTDHLTNCVSNDEYKLNNIKTYEREINSKLLASYNDILSMIFTYCG